MTNNKSDPFSLWQSSQIFAEIPHGPKGGLWKATGEYKCTCMLQKAIPRAPQPLHERLVDPYSYSPLLSPKSKFPSGGKLLLFFYL